MTDNVFGGTLNLAQHLGFIGYFTTYTLWYLLI